MSVIVFLKDVARFERSKGDIYPEGSILVQVDAARGQILYLDEQEEVEDKYAVITTKGDIPSKYLFYSILSNAAAFFAKEQTGLNLQVDRLGFMELYIEDDEEKRLEQIKLLDAIEHGERLVEKQIALAKTSKQTLLSKLMI